MALLKITEDLEKIIEDEDLRFFNIFCLSFGENYNIYILNDKFEDTQLNVLHILCGYENTDFALKIIRKWLSFDKVDINFKGTIEGNFGITAAHIAVMNHNTRTLELLIESNCDLLICDSFGKNVHDYALRENNTQPELLEIILKSLGYSLNKSFNNDCKDRFFDLDQHEISSIHSDNEDEHTKREENVSVNNVSEYFDLPNDNLVDEDTFNEDIKTFNTFQNENSSTIQKKKPSSDNITEILFHEDKDENIEFLEERTRGTDFLIEEQMRMNGGQNGSNSSRETDCANTSAESVIDDLILKMTNAQLRERLREHGMNPGPINLKTKKLYMKKSQ